MIRFIGIFMVCLLAIGVITGVAHKLGESADLESRYTSVELAASFLAGGLIVFVYKDRLSGKKEKP